MSNETDDGEGGFVFHQLGTLNRFTGDCRKTRNMEDLGRGSWWPTGFCVGVRFGSSGRSEGIYIFYDMFPENIEGDRVEIESGNDWGRLELESTLQFSCAKVETTIRALQPDSTGFKTLTMTEVVHHPVELVSAVRSSDGGIIRATVADTVR